RSALAFAGMAGPLMLAVTDISAAFGAPGYNYIRDSISSLALTRIGFIQTIGFMAIGLLIEIFVAGLMYSIRRVRGFHLSIGLLVFFGFALLLIGAFRTDPVNGPETIEGAIHGFMATTAFWLFPIAVFFIAPSIRSDPAWSSLYRYTLVTDGLAVVLVILIGVLGDHISWFGLLERLLVFNMIAWVEVAAFRMLCISVSRG
ncbi:MAG: DUF998 domain-containing protein, partial [Dehalococcoidales bacterium]|nr:DUF998 domain-containing protein [Dehalococcoidales bacterium]